MNSKTSFLLSLLLLLSSFQTQAGLFGPKGDSLVSPDVTFDGYPAVSVLVRSGEREGLVYLSPIHGDDRKSGMTDLEPGARCELLCPVSKEPLDRVGDLENDEGTRYYAIYLTPQLSAGSMVAVSDEWGHYHSRIVDNFELIATWMGEDESRA